MIEIIIYHLCLESILCIVMLQRPVLRDKFRYPKNLESNAVNKESNEHDDASGSGTYHYIFLIQNGDLIVVQMRLTCIPGHVLLTTVRYPNNLESDTLTPRN